LAALRRAEERFPKSALRKIFHYHSAYIESLVKLGRGGETLRYVDPMNEGFPGFVDALFYTALVYVTVRRFREAVVCFDKYLLQKPHEAAARRLRAVAVEGLRGEVEARVAAAVVSRDDS